MGQLFRPASESSLNERHCLIGEVAVVNMPIAIKETANKVPVKFRRYLRVFNGKAFSWCYSVFGKYADKLHVSYRQAMSFLGSFKKRAGILNDLARVHFPVGT